MSVTVSSSTVVSPLWAAAEATSLPETIPVHEAGIFLSFQLTGEKRGATADEFTFVAFHPVDETCFVFGTASGKAYGVSLQDNKVFLLADLGSGALRCGIFCPGYLTSPIVVLVKTGNWLVFVDWQRGTVVQETVMAAHTQPILRLITGPSTESLFCAVSADAFSCWEPVVAGVGVSHLDVQHRGFVDVQGIETKAPTPNAAAAPVKGDQRSETPFYTCTGSAVPTHGTLERLQELTKVPVQRQGKNAQRFVGLHVLDPSLLLSVESNNVLSLWKRRTNLSGVPVVPDSRSDSSRTADVANGTSVAPLEARLQLRESVAAPSTLRLRCSATCGLLLAVGADAVTTSKQGTVVEPVVAFIDAHTLAGSGVVQLPGNGYNSGKAAVTVVQVSALQSDLVACLLSSGVVHVVLPSTYHLVFTIQPPSAFPGNDALLRSLPPSSASWSRKWWSFTPSGPTFGARYRNNALVLLHLPTARKEAAAGNRSLAQKPTSPTMRRSHSILQRRQNSPVKIDNVNNTRDSARPASPVVSPQTAVASSPLTLAQPFLRHRPTSKPSAGASAGTYNGADFPSSASQMGGAGETVAEVAAALLVLATCHPPPAVPPKGFPTKWVDVNLVDVGFADADGLAGGGDASEKTNEASSDPAAGRQMSEQDLWSEAKFCDTLPAVSCQYNLEQLRAHLMKHGVFPHAYRPLIWRFLVGLPTKARTASQFAAVARRPLHVAVGPLMKPFPLPPNQTRQAIEKAVSCLCWASPVLTLASYLPVLVYPLVVLYRNDVQAVVELALLFFANWGRDFFVCHPLGPMSVLTTMERELDRLDADVSRHLKAVGAGVEVWGWELMTSFFTDVLTGPEWLQVMDHAFAASPMWLFAFHVTLVRRRLRASLMAAVSADEVRRVLSQPAGTGATHSSLLSLKEVVEESYRLHAVWAKRNEDSAAVELLPSSYAKLQTLSPRFEYPEGPVHNPVVLAEKMRELALVQRSQHEEAEAAKRYAAVHKEAEAAAAKEAAFVQQQRARVAAKYDASATAWEVQVALERSRQAQEAQERQLRWDVLQRRTRNAEQLQALSTEMNTIESQLRHDMVDRHMEQLKWGLATHMTDEELSRLQRAAEEQVERAMRHMEENAEIQAREVARFQAEPAVTVDVADAADGDDTVSKSAEQEEVKEPRFSDLQSGKDSSTLATKSTLGEHVDPLQQDDEGTTSDSGADAEVKESVQRHAAKGAPKARSLHCPEQTRVKLLPTTSATDSSSVAPNHETAPVEAPRAADASILSEEAGTESAGANTTSLSATTEAYVSPSKETQPTTLRGMHYPARRPGQPVPRHASYRTSTGSDNSKNSDPTLESFVELRNRVLRRLQPSIDVNAIRSETDASKRRHQTSPEQRGDRRSSTRTHDTPTFSSVSYYTTSTYESRTSTSTTETTTHPASSKTASSSGRRLFDDAPRRDYAAHTKGDDCHVSHSGRQRSAPKAPRHPTAYAATTSTATASASRSTSGENTSPSLFYSDYSEGRSKETASTAASFPRSSTLYSDSTS
ncbi:hypothetical protein ABB37_03883 [Leptomonas pyrrhocoris]|uniref:Rab-GAP TBC domain-containing protein n=1 Tax=Leptomonas pyrrhocoris TaxID=157538 RepID=A0A0N0DWA2_LEPPY|nr:hypothetical protein ABB37_03883 [Leptomonas pyrrhocoris]KPA81538.1 hypothetical protein ABB37_03883 [Leptomonas pyrrhocoris]|eukprot:XP_015659977.1 hypothetical protein ABB37_03883 [Leptomonas pyrrhocoris]